MRLGGKFTTSEYMEQQNDMLLDLDGVLIRLVREPAYEDDGEGGQIRSDDDEDEVTLAEQRFLFWEAAPVAHVARGADFDQIIGMGQRVTTSHVLAGRTDANIQQDDRFEHEGYDYVVRYVHPDHNEQTIAEVDRVASGQR